MITAVISEFWRVFAQTHSKDLRFGRLTFWRHATAKSETNGCSVHSGSEQEHFKALAVNRLFPDRLSREMIERESQRKKCNH